MTDLETYPGPFVVDDTTVPDAKGITKALAARALAEPGFEADKAAVWWKNTVARGLLHPYRRQVSAARPHFLYRFDQVFIAAVLHRMSEAGHAGEEVYASAALALNSFQILDLMTQADLDTGKPVPVSNARNPACWVIANYSGGWRGFDFEFCTFCHKTTGQVLNLGRVHHRETASGTDWHLGAEWTRRSVWAVELDPIIAHLTRPKPKAH